jgi:hypothetical protein
MVFWEANVMRWVVLVLVRAMGVRSEDLRTSRQEGLGIDMLNIRLGLKLCFGSVDG